MQSYGLTVDKFLDHAAKWHRDCEVVEAERGRVSARVGYGALRTRSNAFSGALGALGLRLGDRVATLAWNTQHHFETYYAAMGVGLVCHTLNPRVTLEHLTAIVDEAGDRVLAASASLMPLAEALAERCASIEHLIVMDGDAACALPSDRGVRVWRYEELLESAGAEAVWGAFDEEAPAGLCYTSGTTGMPKGVLYTHRSNYLHTLRALQADAMGLTSEDVVLVAVPMFHANGWGLPFAAPAVGAKLVLPGRHTDGESLARLMRDEKVTIAVGVQTVWMGVVDQLAAADDALPDLKRVLIGGSACPEALIRRMEDVLGARVQTSWGMTELSPLGTIAPPDARHATTTSGRPVMGLDLKLKDADGATLAEQRGVVGHLWVRGASVVDRYYNADSDALDAEGYFDTGDLALIDEDGNLTIGGRSKDLIKSGGEWINPAEIEAIVGRDPAVGLVAVIARPDSKWGERPVLVVEPRQGHELDAGGLIRSLRGKVADWWIPDQVARVPAMPLAASGKIDKGRLRDDFASGRLEADAVGD
jgi:3-(methylthio)propionyl---CoA ligase